MSYSLSVSNVSISPKNFTYGDVISVTATVINTGTSSVSGLSFFILDSGSNSLGYSGWVFDGKIGAGKSKTITCGIAINTKFALELQNDMLENGYRSTSGFRLDAQSLQGNSTTIIDDVVDLDSLFFDEHKDVSISEFSVTRCDGDGNPNNEGKYASFTAVYSMPSSFSCTFVYPRAEQRITMQLSSTVQNKLIEDASFDTLNDYSFNLIITDGIETVEVVTQLNSARANLHLSGVSTGGVAFGKFSSATEGVPKLESNYQATFYKGITGVNVWRATEVKTGGRWIDNKPLYRRTFHCIGSGTPEDGQRYILIPKTNLPDYEFIRIIDSVAKYSYSGSDGYWVSGNYANGEGTSQLQHDNLHFYIHPSHGIKMAAGTYESVTEAWVTIEYTKTTDSEVETDGYGNATGTAVSISDDSGSGSGGGSQGGTEDPDVEYFKEYSNVSVSNSSMITLYANLGNYYPVFTLKSGSTAVFCATSSPVSAVRLEEIGDSKTNTSFVLKTGGVANTFIFSNTATISISYMSSIQLAKYTADDSGVITVDDSSGGSGSGDSITFPAEKNVTASSSQITWVTINSVEADGAIVPVFTNNSSNEAVVFKFSEYGNTSSTRLGEWIVYNEQECGTLDHGNNYYAVMTMVDGAYANLSITYRKA